MFLPRHRISPSSGFIKPHINRKRLVLPLPFVPTSWMPDPGSREKLRSRKIRRSPRMQLTFWTSRLLRSGSILTLNSSCNFGVSRLYASMIADAKASCHPRQSFDSTLRGNSLRINANERESEPIRKRERIGARRGCLLSCGFLVKTDSSNGEFRLFGDRLDCSA